MNMGDKAGSLDFIHPFSSSTLLAFLDKYPGGVIFTDKAGKVLFYNEASVQILGTPGKNYTGSNISDIICDKRGSSSLPCLTEFINEKTPIIAGDKIEITTVTNNGEKTPLVVSRNLITEQGHTLVFYFIEDISQQVNLQQRLYEQTITDPLTGLFNRRYFDDRLAQEFKRANRHSRPFSAVIIDIDGFKQANDLHGHLFGDEMLVKATECFQRVLREEDTVYRYGGDEFAMILPETTKEGAVDVAEKLKEAFVKHAAIREKRIKLSLSIGVASFPEDGNNEVELIGSADRRMYTSKESGGNLITAHDSFSHFQQSTEVMLRALSNLAHLMEKKRGFSSGGINHSQSIRTLAIGIGKELGLSKDRLMLLEQAAMLHDIGTLYIPSQTLYKKTPLDEHEWDEVKRHTLIGEEIIEMVSPKDSPMLEELRHIIGQHHERIDGSGYPRGLKNGEITREAQIIGISDAYSAMLSRRPYRNALNKKEALGELKSRAGSYFDPDIVDMLLRLESDDA